MIAAAQPPQPDSLRIQVRGQICRMTKMEADRLGQYAKLLLKAGATSLRGLRGARTGQPGELRPALRRIYLSLEPVAGFALANLDLAKQLTPAEQREIVACQNQLNNPEPGAAWTRVGLVNPASTVLPVQGQAVQLQAMAGEDCCEWAEIQVLCAQQQILASRLTGEKLEQTCTQLALAERNLVERAWPGAPQATLTAADRAAIILAQDKLNLVPELTEVFEIYAARAYLKVGV